MARPLDRTNWLHCGSVTVEKGEGAKSLAHVHIEGLGTGEGVGDFGWGYRGTGPTFLAAAMLRELGYVILPDSRSFHSDVMITEMTRVVALLPQRRQGWKIAAEPYAEWMIEADAARQLSGMDEVPPAPDPVLIELAPFRYRPLPASRPATRVIKPDYANLGANSGPVVLTTGRDTQFLQYVDDTASIDRQGHTVFGWGYEGTGPMNLAETLLRTAGASEDEVSQYDGALTKLTSSLPSDWELDLDRIQHWLDSARQLDLRGEDPVVPAYSELSPPDMGSLTPTDLY